MSKGICFGVAVVFLLSGCGLSELRRDRFSHLLPASERRSLLAIPTSHMDARQTERLNADIEAKIEEAEALCTPLLRELQGRSAARRKWPTALLITGIVAGSLVVPALAASNASANAGWIAAAGGLSGAATGASKVLDSAGLSGSSDAVDRNKLAETIRAELVAAMDESKEPKERYAAASSMYAACYAPDFRVPSFETDRQG